MKAIDIKQLVRKAKELQKQGKKWHFHMLTPDCIFNKKDKNAFILENETDHKVFVVYSDKRYMKEGKVLVKMLHGDKILGKKELNLGKSDKKFNVILENAKKLNEKGIKWHHHTFFPYCIFNKHKGKWCIAFEDKNRLVEFISEQEPVENLRKIEILYYKQKD